MRAQKAPSPRTSPPRPRLLVGLLSGLVLCLVTTLPASAQYSATSGDLTVVEQDRCSWDLSGDGFAPGATITIELSKTGVVATADASGSFRYTLEISRLYAPGRQTLSVSGPNTIGGLHTLSKSVVVKGGCETLGTGLIDRLPDPPSAPQAAGQLAVVMATALLLAALTIGGQIQIDRSNS